MFRREGLKDPELALVYNAASKWEADQAAGILEQADIPALVLDREDSGQYLRVLGLGSPFGVDVYVNAVHAEQARRILDETFSEMENLSEEELAELALNSVKED